MGKTTPSCSRTLRELVAEQDYTRQQRFSGRGGKVKMETSGILAVQMVDSRAHNFTHCEHKQQFTGSEEKL